MADREKLIELLMQKGFGEEGATIAADHLIANGVTFATDNNVVGKWIDRDGKTWCSRCDASNKQYKPPYCPHCGAKMEVNTDGTE